MKKITPIIIIVLWAMASCHRPKNVSEGTESAFVDYTDSRKPYNPNDSFIVTYRQMMNGYKVKAVVKMAHFEINSADITFTKDGKSFTLHTTSYGDSTFNKGGWGMDGENYEKMMKYRNKTVEADYHENREKDYTMPIYTPFFFMDLDFDGTEELVIVHHSMAVRYHDGYDVYRIVEGKPFLIDYPPYKSGVYDDFGMTDYPKFDFKMKTITSPYPEGEMKYDGCTIYGVSKKKKDIVVVNGRKHFFNHLEPIKEIKY